MKTSALNYSAIDIQELLKERRQIALIWGIEDVKEIRPDLTDDEAWTVLQRCEDDIDCTVGLTWDVIDSIADELFPTSESDI